MTTPPPIPKRDGPEAEYLALRTMFTGFGLTKEAICARLQIEALHNIDPFSTFDYGPVENRTDAIIRIFVEGRDLSAEDLEKWFGAQNTALLKDYDLIAEDEPGRWAATVSLYPIENIFTATDR